MGAIQLGCLWKSAARRDTSREWGRLKAKVEHLLTLGNSGFFIQVPRDLHCSRRSDTSSSVLKRITSLVEARVDWKFPVN